LRIVDFGFRIYKIEDRKIKGLRDSRIEEFNAGSIGVDLRLNPIRSIP
jgi:hypothetical protein